MQVRMRRMLIPLMIFAAISMTGCSKDDQESEPPTPMPEHVKNLVGLGNRVWRLREVYQNGVPLTLTSSQLKYTKTYTIDPSGGSIGRFTNDDGFVGTWKYDEVDKLEEKITNTPSIVTIQYKVLKLTKDTLDISYVFGPNNITIREVYFGF
jgi:hypothetical protein